jgi:MFS family permease
LALTAVAGPALAGITVESFGAAAAMCLVAAAFAVCALLVSTLDPYVEEAAVSVRARLAAVREYLQTAPQLRKLLLTQAAALVFFESGFPIEIAYAKSTLKVGEGGWGVMVAVWGVGMIGGSLIFARSERRLGRMLIAGTLAVGVAYLGFACAPALAPACVAAFVGGVGNGVQWASLLGAVQRATPQRLLGRMMGAVEAIGAASPALGLCLGGAITAIASPRIAFLAMGLGACATTAAFVVIGGVPGRSRAGILWHEDHDVGDPAPARAAMARTTGGTAQAEPVK